MASFFANEVPSLSSLSLNEGVRDDRNGEDNQQLTGNDYDELQGEGDCENENNEGSGGESDAESVDGSDDDSGSESGSLDSESSYESSSSTSSGPPPEHACRYCLISDPETVAKCVETNKWMCNCSSKTSATPGSHIVSHLVRSRSHTVQLHKDSPLGDTVLECYNCSAKNVFILGFVPAKSDSVVVLLCRACVETVPSLKDMDWELGSWTSLIQDRQFLPWLVKVPTEKQVIKSVELSAAQIIRLEDLWKNGEPEASHADLDRPDVVEDEAQPALLNYEDGYHYQNILAPLVKMEADYDKEMKESLSEESISLEWSRSLGGKHIATFSFGRDASESRLMIGDELRLKLGVGGVFMNSGKEWEALGYVKSILDGEIELEMKCPHVIENITDDYIVEYVWKSTSFDRMQNALKTLAIDDTSLSGFIYHKLLGHDVDSTKDQIKAILPETLEGYTAPGLPNLNESQAEAVKAVLQSPFSLIQGPPGTGKTVTSATLVYHLHQQKQGQILVTAPSNVAVDQLTEKIAATGLKVVRLASKTRENTVSSVDHLCLHIMTPLAAPEEFTKLQQLKDEVGELSQRDERKWRSLKLRTEKEILACADIITCTCVMAGDNRLNGMRFRQVLLDEATQAVEAEALIPITLGCKQLVLVGDHAQLGPVVMNKKAAKAGLTQSLFERMVLVGVRPQRLSVQYRMHPALSEFPSLMFYEGSLANGVTEDDRSPSSVGNGRSHFAWPVPRKPMFFYSIVGVEEISASGTSYLNRTEASYVEKCVTHLLRQGVKPDKIGVITPYEGQRKYVNEYMRRSGILSASLYEAIEVASVDAFQGREKDYILVTCVRASEITGIGFLSDPRRLNVALTRARLGLIVIGNAKVLSRNILWRALLLHFKENECLVEGALNSLQPSYMTFPRPRYRKDDDEKYYMTALCRGGWDARWEGDNDEGNRTNNNNRHGGRGGRRGRGGNDGDSRHDPRYKNVGRSSDKNNNGSSNITDTFNFAPLPSYDGDQGYTAHDDPYNQSQSQSQNDSYAPFTQMSSIMSQSQHSVIGGGSSGEGGGGGGGLSQDSSHYSDYYYSQSQS